MKRFFILSLIVIAVLGLGGTYFFYDKYQAAKTDPRAEDEKRNMAIIAAVAELMQLPTDEMPTVATVSDKEKLGSQTFFETVENGDVLLAYPIWMKVILYRPKTHKIINVAPLSLSQPRIAYYNGTAISGLSALAEKTVKAQYPDWSTVILKEAARKDYRKTLIVNLSGRYAQEARHAADLLEGDVESLPAGEAAPEADILIISGK